MKSANTSRASTLAALPAAMFSTTVTQPGRLGPVPDDVEEKTHHVRNGAGKTTKFANPHESFVPPELWDIFTMMW